MRAIFRLQPRIHRPAPGPQHLLLSACARWIESSSDRSELEKPQDWYRIGIH